MKDAEPFKIVKLTKMEFDYASIKDIGVWVNGKFIVTAPAGKIFPLSRTTRAIAEKYLKSIEQGQLAYRLCPLGLTILAAVLEHFLLIAPIVGPGIFQVRFSVLFSRRANLFPVFCIVTGLLVQDSLSVLELFSNVGGGCGGAIPGRA
jgi:hypothetical protein